MHLADPAALGLDAAFPAGFVALIVPQLRRRPGRASALAGALLALVGLPTLPSGAPILLAALGVLAGVAMLRRNDRPATEPVSEPGPNTDLGPSADLGDVGADADVAADADLAADSDLAADLDASSIERGRP